MSQRVVEQYKNYLKFVSHYSQATIDSYLNDLEVFLNEVKNQYMELSSNQIQDIFYAWSKNISNASLARRLSAIRQFYQFLISTNEIEVDPTLHLKVNRKDKKLPEYLTLEEVVQLTSFELKTYDDFLDKAIIEILFSCGLRVSELITLTHSRYYKQEGFFKIIGKGAKERIVPIGTRAQHALEDYLVKVPKKSTITVFVNIKSLPLSRQSVYNRIRKRQVQTELRKNVTPHMLRHSFASALINNDADLRVVQELLGHEVISTTQIYTHLESKSKKRMYDQFHPGQLLKKGNQDNE